jgi:hypothetical protein
MRRSTRLTTIGLGAATSLVEGTPPFSVGNEKRVHDISPSPSHASQPSGRPTGMRRQYKRRKNGNWTDQ